MPMVQLPPGSAISAIVLQQNHYYLSIKLKHKTKLLSHFFGMGKYK